MKTTIKKEYEMKTYRELLNEGLATIYYVYIDGEEIVGTASLQAAEAKKAEFIKKKWGTEENTTIKKGY